MRKILLLIIPFILFSCYHTQKEMTFDMSKVLPMDKMVSLFTDLQLVEGAVNIKQRESKPLDRYSQIYLDYVLKQHNITREELDESVRYYTYHIQELDKVYEQVIINLSRLEIEVNNK
jgi:hypothetical protein